MFRCAIDQSRDNRSLFLCFGGKWEATHYAYQRSNSSTLWSNYSMTSSESSSPSCRFALRRASLMLFSKAVLGVSCDRVNDLLQPAPGHFLAPRAFPKSSRIASPENV